MSYLCPKCGSTAIGVWVEVRGLLNQDGTVTIPFDEQTVHGRYDLPCQCRSCGKESGLIDFTVED